MWHDRIFFVAEGVRAWIGGRTPKIVLVLDLLQPEKGTAFGVGTTPIVDQRKEQLGNRNGSSSGFSING